MKEGWQNDAEGLSVNDELLWQHLEEQGRYHGQSPELLPTLERVAERLPKLIKLADRFNDEEREIA